MEAGAPQGGGIRSRAVTAEAESSTMSAELCSVATRHTSTSEASGAGTNARMARGSVSFRPARAAAPARGERDRRRRPARRPPSTPPREARDVAPSPRRGRRAASRRRRCRRGAEGRRGRATRSTSEAESVATTGKRGALGGSSPRPEAAARAHASAIPGMPATMSAYWTQVRAHDGELASERGVQDEDGGRSDDREDGIEAERRRQDERRAPRSAARTTRSRTRGREARPRARGAGP